MCSPATPAARPSSASFLLSTPCACRCGGGEEPFVATPEQAFEWQQNENSYYFQTDSLRMRIQKQPWQLQIFRGDGDLVFSQVPGQSGFIKTSDGATSLRIAAAMRADEAFLPRYMFKTRAPAQGHFGTTCPGFQD